MSNRLQRTTEAGEAATKVSAIVERARALVIICGSPSISTVATNFRDPGMAYSLKTWGSHMAAPEAYALGGVLIGEAKLPSVTELVHPIDVTTADFSWSNHWMRSLKTEQSEMRQVTTGVKSAWGFWHRDMPVPDVGLLGALSDFEGYMELKSSVCYALNSNGLPSHTGEAQPPGNAKVVIYGLTAPDENGKRVIRTLRPIQINATVATTVDREAVIYKKGGNVPAAAPPVTAPATLTWQTKRVTVDIDF